MVCLSVANCQEMGKKVRNVCRLPSTLFLLEVQSVWLQASRESNAKSLSMMSVWCMMYVMAWLGMDGGQCCYHVPVIPVGNFFQVLQCYHAPHTQCTGTGNPPCKLNTALAILDGRVGATRQPQSRVIDCSSSGTSTASCGAALAICLIFIALSESSLSISFKHVTLVVPN